MKRIVVLMVILVMTFFACDDNPSQTIDKCKDVTCENWQTCEEGTCKLKDGFCDTSCEDNKICNSEHQCIEKLTCEGVSCSNHGNCILHNDVPTCLCETDYKPSDNLTCIHKRSCGDTICSLNSKCVEDKCVCDDGFIYSSLIKKCIKDEKCENVTCDENEYCSDGNCFLKEECSVTNLDGICPTIENIIFECIDGLCISPNNGTKERGEKCEPDNTDCKRGLICTDVFNDKDYHCRDFCDLTTENSCPDNGICAPAFDVFTRNTGTCIFSDCTPNGNECTDGKVCEKLIDIYVCQHNGDVALDGECDNDPETTLDYCKTGLYCIGDKDEVKKCVELCDPNSTDECVNGRCIKLSEIDETIQNDDIGLCADIPNFCNGDNGMESNPDCDADAICFSYEPETAICIADECELDSSSCEAGEGCSRSYHSKNSCFKVGDLGLNETGCIIVEDINENTPDSQLCEAGLVCVGEDNEEKSCVKFCDLSAENQCPGDDFRCVDLNSIIEEFPTGVNGVCFNGPELCQTSGGIINNPTCSGEDDVCFPTEKGAEVGFCDKDTCNLTDGCEEGNFCTRAPTSKRHCVKTGDLAYKAEGCVSTYDNPNAPTSKLCDDGLSCVKEKCQEFCDPVNPACVNGTTCVDLHLINTDFPSGINGFCQ